jgi:hypothetical protein
LGLFEGAMLKHGNLSFTPLLLQWQEMWSAVSAIIVQGLQTIPWFPFND